ncbi:hypothetical protein DUT90_09280 [Polaribacter sp. WD7]|uniref:hypothetical protein n=1 Tax=Polaribacter sp. WD7 TaxID=2269061 RepID=UPI000DF4A8A9|nr:hypothetical protein [Polaribacter sp. WD7]RCS25963.1 hypothetical protein DUT90_09280 [Polaribacter sp. WD7]
MKLKLLSFVLITTPFLLFAIDNSDYKNTLTKEFNIEKDLLLVQFDCKTDVDDLHTVAAFATLVANPKYSKLKYHPVTGTYGIQKGLYVPPNDLFDLAFGNKWTDAHKDVEKALKKVTKITKRILRKNGDIWIAEAGQSDFTAKLIKVLQNDLPKVNITQRVHLVQHSSWNEKSTAPKSLAFVKNNTNYHKIPDGNIVANGSPGFSDAAFVNWENEIKNAKLLKIWQRAIDISNQYNGKDKRYNNKHIAQGGLDFSDLSEVCWILNLNYIKNVEHFFNLYLN